VVKELDDKDVRYQEFDFHHECKLDGETTRVPLVDLYTRIIGKGMKYENISKLITQLSSTFSEQGYVQLWMTRSSAIPKYLVFSVTSGRVKEKLCVNRPGPSVSTVLTA
jgi:hypothetical protein